MPEFNNNIWAPWRMQYIRSLSEEAEDHGCFLCHYWNHPEQDAENHVIWRCSDSFALMNRFPYTNGHLMIATRAHEGDMTALADEILTELGKNIRKAVGILKTCVKAQGFNIGYNLGLCAGAGLPDHLHAHIVPRWSGDTNYMAVLGDSRVVPDALDALYRELVVAASQAGPAD
ncbi:MAG: HIT family protein [Planctomycetota bacterium]|jgi:ATP adenylyltransferase